MKIFKNNMIKNINRISIVFTLLGAFSVSIMAKDVAEERTFKNVWYCNWPIIGTILKDISSTCDLPQAKKISVQSNKKDLNQDRGDYLLYKSQVERLKNRLLSLTSQDSKAGIRDTINESASPVKNQTGKKDVASLIDLVEKDLEDLLKNLLIKGKLIKNLKEIEEKLSILENEQEIIPIVTETHKFKIKKNLLNSFNDELVENSPKIDKNVLKQITNLNILKNTIKELQDTEKTYQENLKKLIDYESQSQSQSKSKMVKFLALEVENLNAIVNNGEFLKGFFESLYKNIENISLESDVAQILNNLKDINSYFNDDEKYLNPYIKFYKHYYKNIKTTAKDMPKSQTLKSGLIDAYRASPTLRSNKYALLFKEMSKALDEIIKLNSFTALDHLNNFIELKINVKVIEKLINDKLKIFNNLMPKNTTNFN